MLDVKSINEVYSIIETLRDKILIGVEKCLLLDCLGRISAETIYANENIPSFNRSAVDGYACRSSDINGCSESIPIYLKVVEEVSMGKMPEKEIGVEECTYVPTGGEIPKGADTMIMVEYSEKFYDSYVAIFKSSSPGRHIIFKGDDVRKGDVILKEGDIIDSRIVAILSAVGICEVNVLKKPLISIISTGNELILPNENISDSKVRDINGQMLQALVKEDSCDVKFWGIIEDDYNSILNILNKATNESDLIIITGGTSAGEKDEISNILVDNGTMFVHGIAVKPGKPTIIGCLNDKIIFSLPGHPQAVFFMYSLLVRKFLRSLRGLTDKKKIKKAYLSKSVVSNNGRAEFVLVNIEADKAVPIFSKSSIISSIVKADGYIIIPRNCEGIKENSLVTVNIL